MSTLKMAMKRPNYQIITIAECIKFAGHRGGDTHEVEFFIECDADTQTFQRCFERKEK